MFFFWKAKRTWYTPDEIQVFISDLVLFYRIIKNDIKIELQYYVSRVEPHDVINIPRNSKATADGSDNLKFACKIYPKIKTYQVSYLF